MGSNMLGETKKLRAVRQECNRHFAYFTLFYISNLLFIHIFDSHSDIVEERENLSTRLHFPNGHNIWSRDKAKPGVRNSIQVSQVDNRD